ncbi:MAG: RNA binding protein snu13 [Watsoniomyces obsoletus]|nr:MAG: RNA binding protein snu13 [Watsoniomyces obsoletus]
MDEATATLILKYQLSDLDEILKEVKKKDDEEEKDTTSIIDVFAFELYREELNQCMTSITDRRMARSISRAVQDDGPIIINTQVEEDLALQDHELASRIAAGIPCNRYRATPPMNKTPIDHLNETTTESILRQFRHLNILPSLERAIDDPFILEVPSQEDDDVGEGPSHSSSIKGISYSSISPQEEECVACMERKPSFEIFKAPCSHIYCHRCLIRLFEDAQTDDSLFPPKCCRQQIPLSSVSGIIGGELTSRTEYKTIELETVDRTYCAHRPQCGVFIIPEQQQQQQRGQQHRMEGYRITCQMGIPSLWKL